MEFVRKAGNLYCEGTNLWLQLASYKLPSPKVKTESHQPGGGIMEIEVPVGAIDPLALGFNTKSADPRILGVPGMSLSESRLWTIYEELVDERSATKRERIITLRGVLNEASPEEMAGRGLKGYEHSIGSITDYEDVIEGYGIVARFNYWRNEWQGYGVNSDNRSNQILRISG
ncbi:phage major tail tube protein [Kaistia sp. MMO-174]|uniref:phage major tail tube protein n=1 Tax=Kaistia sp. MMO-174 TaxID=3081256 RepID=UPI003019302D